MSNKFNIAIALSKTMAESILDAEDLDFLSSFADFNPVDELPETMTAELMTQLLKNADACITCWGTPSFSEEMLAQAEKLSLIAHSAGSIKNLIPKTYWDTGKRRITSNAALIAEDVAQSTLTLILCSLKGFWDFAKTTRSGGWSGGQSSFFKIRRLDGLKVGLVSGSNVGKEVIKALKPYGCSIVLYDPYISPIEANELGVTLTDLDDLMATCDVISLHAPGNEDCRHMINAKNAPLMKDGALFINTARGILVDEAALLKELETGRIFACIDVTDPEPPVADHPFRTLENVVLLPHITGGHTVNGRKSLGRNSIRKIYTYLHKGILDQEIRFEMLDIMA